MTGPKIVEAVNLAIKRLRDEERPLQEGASERSFAHRLAVQMEDLFLGWDIDCDYNRDDVLTKMLEGIKGCTEQKTTNIILPDIIVHRRKQPGHDANLLVIEMKLNDRCDTCDKTKLEKFTNPTDGFWYHVGLYINIRRNAFDKTWYQGGTQKNELEIL
jgi:hypothetical protein